jgi:FAD/FMN-containing dehydrogenase
MTAPRSPHALADGLEQATLAAAGFGHREHLAAAYALLQRHPFAEAAWRYARGIERLATGAGAPEKFNTTVTLAWLSLVAEAMADSPRAGFDRLLANHPPLLDRHRLQDWYAPHRLYGDRARRMFLLP